MTRSSVFTILWALALLQVSVAFQTQCSGLTVASQMNRQRVWRRNGVASLTAKKGKPNVPIQQRGGYMAQQKMRDQMKQMRPESNGFPIFNLYVQTPRANMWYPCGNLQGDERSKSLVDGWMSNSMGMGGIVKGNIDKSIAASVFAGNAFENLKNQVVQLYPALKNAKNELEFGYKIEYDGLEDAVGKQEVTILSQEMSEGPLDKLKNMLNF